MTQNQSMGLACYWRLAAPSDLPAVLQDLHDKAHFAFAILEWWNKEAQLLTVAEGLKELVQQPGDLLSGSLFGEQAEVRFRQVPAGYGGEDAPDKMHFWLVLTANRPLELAGDWQVEAQPAQEWDGEVPKAQNVILWGGKRQPDGSWLELKIPRPLLYPVVPQKGKVDGVVLESEVYHDRAGGIVASRRIRLSAVQAGG